MSTSFILLEISPGMINLFFIGAMFIVIWLFMLRPQAKKTREQSKFMEELKVDDEVVTNAGILGKVYKIDGNIVTLEVSNKTFIRVTKNVISKELSDWLKNSSNKLIVS